MNNSQNPNFSITRRGFTLIELSIVLVIIGLVVGGVVTGRTLIQSAQLQRQITQIKEYETAFVAF